MARKTDTVSECHNARSANPVICPVIQSARYFVSQKKSMQCLRIWKVFKDGDDPIKIERHQKPNGYQCSCDTLSV